MIGMRAFKRLIFATALFMLLHVHGFYDKPPVEYNIDLERIVIHSDELSLSHFKFNQENKASEWVDRNLGHRSIFYNSTSEITMKNINDLSSIDSAVIKQSRQFMIDELRISEDAFFPSCSVEMLGFISRKPNLCPVCDAYLGKRPSTGTGKFIVKDAIMWKCYYRVQYENWRNPRGMPLDKYSHYVVLIYCPAPTNKALQCARFQRLFDLPEDSRRSISEMRVNAALTLELGGKEISESSFKIAPVPSYTVNMVLRNHQYEAERQEKQDIAICLPIPYVPTKDNMALVSATLVRDFVHYHSNLGLKVMLYDNRGLYRDMLLGNGGLAPDGVTRYNLAYHDYTMLGLLQANNQAKSTALEIDATQKLFFHKTDTDKILTLTHCRLEAKSVYNIDKVVVADYDEFLYCPKAKGNLTLVAEHFRNHVQYFQDHGFEQLLHYNHWMVNKSDNVQACVENKVVQGESLYDCFGPYKHKVSLHAVKATHIGNPCPLTTFHEACDYDRKYNCICQTKTFKRTCSYIHISLGQAKYKKKWYKQVNKLHMFVDKPLELKGMLTQPPVLSSGIVPKTRRAKEFRHSRHCTINEKQ